MEQLCDCFCAPELLKNNFQCAYRFYTGLGEQAAKWKDMYQIFTNGIKVAENSLCFTI